MPSPDRMIWNKFRIKAGDLIPFRAWEGKREKFAELFAEMKFTLGAEVGVETGIFSETLLNGNPNLRMILVDPWTEYRNQGHWMAAENGERNLRRAQKRLGHKNVEWKRMTSMEAVKTVKDGSLDFVYIDALHEFDAVMLDVIHWSPKVRIGGIVAGHDFHYNYRGGVIAAIEAYTRGHSIWPWYITNEPFPSWFWVKKNYP